MKYLQWTFLLILGLLFVACTTGTDEAASDLESPTFIHDTAWNITSFDDGTGNMIEVLEGTEITANFAKERIDGGTVYGFTGCNQITVHSCMYSINTTSSTIYI